MNSKPAVFAVLAYGLIFGSILGACTAADTHQQASPTQGTTQVTQQPSARVIAGIIVKPKSPVADGETLMKRIGEKLRAPERLAFNRPMSGDAYVLRAVAAQGPADVQALITELTATGLFEYVEADSMMTIHAP